MVIIFTTKSSVFCPHSVFICVVRILEQTEFISPYNTDWLVFITDLECIYSAERIEFWCIIEVILVLDSYTAEFHIRSQICPYEICGWQSGAGIYFSPNTLVFPFLYHSINAPFWPSYSHYFYWKGKWSKLGNTHKAIFLWRSGSIGEKKKNGILCLVIFKCVQIRVNQPLLPSTVSM